MKTSLKMTALCLMTALLATGCGRDTKVEFASGGGKVLRHGLVSNKKTNAANKSDEEACIRAFLSAVKQFQESARDAGATKVVNLISYYKKKPFSSTTRYECHAGGVLAGVALKGDLAQ